MIPISSIPNAEDPIARQRARNLLSYTDGELKRRAADHQAKFNEFWHSGDCTPTEILAEMGTSAAAFMTASSLNIQTIAQCAPLLGKTLADYLPEESYNPPAEMTVHDDGHVTINQ